METPDFLKSMKVKELQDFLRPYGAQTTGKKEDLLRRATLYYKTHGKNFIGKM